MSVLYAAGIAVGFNIALILMAGIREQLSLTETPKGMKGFPLSLVTAGLLSLAFMGFSGIVK
jgi:electron transport complex protein RnfA